MRNGPYGLLPVCSGLLRCVLQCRNPSGSLCSPAAWCSGAVPYTGIHNCISTFAWISSLIVLLPWWDVKTLTVCFPMLCWKALQQSKYHTLQWITWLGGRWRTQLTARRNVNCRTCDHRPFERILQDSSSTVCPMFCSGSFNIHLFNLLNSIEVLQLLATCMPLSCNCLLNQRL